MLVIPTLLVGGSGIDYIRATSVKAKLQKGLDTAVLAGARELATTADPAKARARTKAAFLATAGDEGRKSKLKITADARKVTVSATAQGKVPMIFMALIGIDDMTVNANAQASAKPQTTSALPQQAKPKQPTPSGPYANYSERDIDDLIFRVKNMCDQLQSHGMAKFLPQCGPVFDGSFEKQLRGKIASNDDVKELIPAGVRLTK